jgi:hypothetical protein
MKNLTSCEFLPILAACLSLAIATCRFAKDGRLHLNIIILFINRLLITMFKNWKFQQYWRDSHSLIQTQNWFTLRFVWKKKNMNTWICLKDLSHLTQVLCFRKKKLLMHLRINSSQNYLKWCKSTNSTHFYIILKCLHLKALHI